MVSGCSVVSDYFDPYDNSVSVAVPSNYDEVMASPAGIALSAYGFYAVNTFFDDSDAVEGTVFSRCEGDDAAVNLTECGAGVYRQAGNIVLDVLLDGKVLFVEYVYDEAVFAFELPEDMQEFALLSQSDQEWILNMPTLLEGELDSDVNATISIRVQLIRSLGAFM